MEFVLGFFVGSFWGPVVLLLLASAFVICSLEYENGVPAALTLASTILIFNFLLKVDVFGYVRENLGWLALYTLGYFVVGALYSILKWGVWFSDQMQPINDRKEKFFREKGVQGSYKNAVPDALKLEWEEYFQRYEHRTLSDAIPQYYNNKSLFLLWITYWPWSFLWLAIKNPIKRIAELIYRKLQAIYQSVADRLSAHIRQDMLTDEKRRELMAAREEQQRAARQAQEDATRADLRRRS